MTARNDAPNAFINRFRIEDGPGDGFDDDDDFDEEGDEDEDNEDDDDDEEQETWQVGLSGRFR